MKRSLLFINLCFASACYKQPEVIFASDLYFIETDQIFNVTGMPIETVYGDYESKSWILIKPYVPIRFAAAQTINKNAVFTHVYGESPLCCTNFAHFNISSKIQGNHDIEEN